jgi:K+:H+ antiporter
MTQATPILAAAPGHILAHVLLALAAVVIAGRLVGALFRRLGQPPVIGEVVAGILLGPSFLGWISQSLFQVNATELLLPKEVAPHLGVIAQLGVILYMFLVGLELNAGLLRAQAKAAIGISAAGMVVPFLLGVALAYPLHERFAPAGVPFSSFTLFLGIALAVTAFPVLARILTDRGIARTRLGVLALSCAAVGDAAAWCLLAVIVGVVQARIDDALLVIGLSAAFIAFMLLAVRPLAARWARRLEGRPLTPGIAAWIFAAVLLSALATEAIGIHGLFGAFLLGVVIPHDCRVARELEHRLKEVVVVLFLPAFFAYTGLRTQIGLISGWEQWLVCGLIILAATLGKFGGTLAAARLTGLDWLTSASLGVLMNTRGLMELIVLNIGLDLGVISPALFTMLVLMALVTTLATAPVLKRLMPREEVPPRIEPSRAVAAEAV